MNPATPGEPGFDATGLGETEPQIVVAVRGVIPVAVSRANVRRFIVPGTPTESPAGSSGVRPLEFYTIKQLSTQTMRFGMAGVTDPALHRGINVTPI